MADKMYIMLSFNGKPLLISLRGLFSRFSSGFLDFESYIRIHPVGDNIDEGQEFGNEYSRLGIYIEEQNRMLEESISKAAKAVSFEKDTEVKKMEEENKQLAAAANKGRLGSLDDIDTRGKLTVDNEREIKDRLGLLLKEMDDGRQQLKKMDENIKKYQQNFINLRTVSGLENVY